MPKNKGKGGKNRRRGKNENEETKRQLEFKEPGQEYAQVVRMLGNGRCECYCFDGKTRLGHIRGKMRKKVWVSAGDIVLCGLREFQDDKVCAVCAVRGGGKAHFRGPSRAHNLVPSVSLCPTLTHPDALIGRHHPQVQR